MNVGAVLSNKAQTCMKHIVSLPPTHTHIKITHTHTCSHIYISISLHQEARWSHTFSLYLMFLCDILVMSTSQFLRLTFLTFPWCVEISVKPQWFGSLPVCMRLHMMYCTTLSEGNEEVTYLCSSLHVSQVQMMKCLNQNYIILF